MLDELSCTQGVFAREVGRDLHRGQINAATGKGARDREIFVMHEPNGGFSDDHPSHRRRTHNPNNLRQFLNKHRLPPVRENNTG